MGMSLYVFCSLVPDYYIVTFTDRINGGEVGFFSMPAVIVLSLLYLGWPLIAFEDFIFSP